MTIATLAGIWLVIVTFMLFSKWGIYKEIPKNVPANNPDARQGPIDSRTWTTGIPEDDE